MKKLIILALLFYALPVSAQSLPTYATLVDCPDHADPNIYNVNYKPDPQDKWYQYTDDTAIRLKDGVWTVISVQENVPGAFNYVPGDAYIFLSVTSIPPNPLGIASGPALAFSPLMTRAVDEAADRPEDIVYWPSKHPQVYTAQIAVDTPTGAELLDLPYHYCKIKDSVGNPTYVECTVKTTGKTTEIFYDDPISGLKKSVWHVKEKSGGW